MQKRLSLFLLVAVVVCSCGGSGRDTAPPVRSLPPEVARHFEAWKGRLVKRCAADDALGSGDAAPGEDRGPAPDPRAQEPWADDEAWRFPAREMGRTGGSVTGVDLAVLRELTGGSARLPDGRGETFLLGAPILPEGRVTSRVQRSWRGEDGVLYGVDAELVQDGDRCETRLFGEKVHETRLAARVPVLAVSRSAGAVVRGAPRLVSAGGVDALVDHGIERAVWAALLPDEAALAALASRAGVSPAAAAIALRAPDPRRMPHSFTVAGALPFGTDDPRLVGPRAVLESLAASGTFHVDARIASPEQGADPWRLDVAVDARSEGRATTYVARVVAFQPVVADAAGAASCFLGRIGALAALDESGADRFSASWPAVAGPCRGLFPVIADAVAGSRDARLALGARFRGIHGDRFASYRGWSVPLREIARAVPRDLPGAIDPDRASPLVVAADRALHVVLARAEPVPALAAHRRELVDMAVQWALNGDEPGDDRAERIVDALAAAWPTFPASAATLALTLADAPLAHDEMIAYALGLTADDAKAVEKAVALAGPLGLSGWAAVKRDTILQSRPSSARIAGWSAFLDALGSFASRERARIGGASADAFEGRLHDLARRGLEDGWDARSLAIVEAALPIGRSLSACAVFPDATSVAACVGLARLSAAEGKLLAPGFGDRYLALAPRAAARLAKLYGPDADELRTAYATAYFSPLWGKCDATAFSARDAALDAGLMRLAAEADPVARARLARELRGALADCGG